MPVGDGFELMKNFLRFFVESLREYAFSSRMGIVSVRDGPVDCITLLRAMQELRELQPSYEDCPQALLPDVILEDIKLVQLN